MVLKLPKIVHFLQICAEINKKSKCIKAIYLYSSERPYHVLSKNSMFYRGLSNSSQNIEEQNILKSAESAKVKQNSPSSNANIF